MLNGLSIAYALELFFTCHQGEMRQTLIKAMGLKPLGNSEDKPNNLKTICRNNLNMT